MDVLRKFYAFTNLNEHIGSLSIMLVLLSLLYCSIYSMVFAVALRLSSTFAYYLFIYLFVILAAYVYMIVMFQFIRNKRKDTSNITMRKYMLPLVGVQTIFYIIMAGSSYVSINMLMQGQKSVLSYPLTLIMILMTLFYIPMQVFVCFSIYDGIRNPFKIIYSAFMKIIHHYQSCFYSFLILLLLVFGYNMIMALAFDYQQPFFAINSIVVEVMTHNNPFMTAFELGINVFKNLNLLAPFIVSVIYGILMCILLVVYYTIMVCIHDKDIKI